MALMNYSLPFGAPIGPSGPNWSSLASGFQPAVQHANAVNGLIYDPAAHQQVHPPLAPDYYPNNPYAPPPPLRQPQFTTNNNYLPPHPPTQSHHTRPSSSSSTTTKHTGYPHSTQPHPQFPSTRTFGESSYSRPSQNDAGGNQQKGTQYFNAENPFTNTNSNSNNKNSRGNPNQRRPASDTKVNTSTNRQGVTNTNNSNQNTKQTIGRDTNKNSPSTGSIPERPGGYVKVQAGTGQKTQSVAVLDYDDDDEDEYYYDDDNGECSSSFLSPFMGNAKFNAPPALYLSTKQQKYTLLALDYFQ